MSALRDLLRANPANLANSPAAPRQNSQDSQGGEPENALRGSLVRDLDLARVRAAARALEAARERRRQRVLAMLTEAPESMRYAWLTDTSSHPDYVIVELAIRGVGTCELSILKDRYDDGRLLEIIAASAGECSRTNSASDPDPPTGHSLGRRSTPRRASS